MDEKRRGRWDEFEKRQLEEFKDHKIRLLFEIVKEGEEKLRRIQEEQLPTPLSDTSAAEINCSFLLGIVEVLREAVYDSMLITWDGEERMEILPEIFFHQTSKQETPNFKKVLKNVVRVFQEEALTSTSNHLSSEQAPINFVLRNYRNKRMDEFMETLQPERKNDEPLTPEQNKERLVVEEKYTLLSEIIVKLDKKKLLPELLQKTSFSEMLLILAELIDAQVELLTEI